MIAPEEKWRVIFGKLKRIRGESNIEWFRKLSPIVGKSPAALKTGYERWGHLLDLTPEDISHIPESSSDYKEIRKKDGTIEVKDVVTRKLTDPQLFERYGRSQNEWRISMVWFKDKPSGGYILSCCFIPRKNEKYINVIEQLKADAKKHAPKYKPFKYKKSNIDSVMVELSIYDLHYGKLCWRKESGADYDSYIAEERFNNALNDLISRAQAGNNIEKILFVYGNDFFNSEGKSNATTAGTPQDTDSRWQKMFTGGRKLLVSGIEKLASIAPVEAIGIYGNHANQAEFYLGDALECWFHKHPNVTVNNNPTARKYILYGNSLIGFTHGNLEKENELPLLMASEVSNLWSKARFREFHRGDKHHEREKVFNTAAENKSVVVRTLCSMSGTDAWHSGAGYVGQRQSAMQFIWSRDNGLQNIYYHNIK